MKPLHLLFVGILILPLSAAAQPDELKKTKDGCKLLYVPSEQVVVEKMLEMAKVRKTDVVFDLGCGDGRIVVTAAKKFGCKGIGIDYDPKRVEESLGNVKKADLPKDLVEIREGDALQVKDLEKASVIMLYMLPEFMEKLEPQMKKRLKPGTRIVAHDYPFPNMDPDQTVEFEVAGGTRPMYLYMWTIREPKKN